jgi:hypothetical protein
VKGEDHLRSLGAAAQPYTGRIQGALTQASGAGRGHVVNQLRDTLRPSGDRRELQEIADTLGSSRKTLWEKKKQWGL